MQLGKTLIVANPAAQRGNGAHAARAALDLLADRIGADAAELKLT